MRPASQSLVALDARGVEALATVRVAPAVTFLPSRLLVQWFDSTRGPPTSWSPSSGGVMRGRARIASPISQCRRGHATTTGAVTCFLPSLTRPHPGSDFRLELGPTLDGIEARKVQLRAGMVAVLPSERGAEIRRPGGAVGDRSRHRDPRGTLLADDKQHRPNHDTRAVTPRRGDASDHRIQPSRCPQRRTDTAVRPGPSAYRREL